MEIIPTQRFALPTELMLFMNDKKITFASWVPTAISLVAQLSPFSMIKPEYLKRLFFVGEVMPMKHLNKWREFLPEIQYVNLYGSSETAGICCYYVVEGEFGNKDLLPIGRPMSNCKAYLLGDEGLITGPDRIGELYLVTDALADGYYHDPERPPLPLW
jgi:acyl-CoA synthetase (AMP-forming)/AMP-acid ligase II